MTPPSRGERGTGPKPPATQGPRRRLRAFEATGTPPSLLPPTYPPNNLPLELSSFIGRESEILEVEQLLVAQTRLLTLTGPGGCGKTRLALAVAREAAGEFANAVRRGGLASLPEPRSAT